MTVRHTIFVCVACLSLAACDLPSAEPRKSFVQDTLPVVPSLPDPSVPSAESVFRSPAASTAQDSAAGRPTGLLTALQSSTQMPMPGQVNNHSTTALDAAKR